MNVFEIQKLAAGPKTDAMLADLSGQEKLEYSTDIAAAMSLVEHTSGFIRQKGDVLNLFQYDGIEWKLWWWPERECWIVDANLYGEWGCRASARELPLAICRALLMVHVK